MQRRLAIPTINAHSYTHTKTDCAKCNSYSLEKKSICCLGLIGVAHRDGSMIICYLCMSTGFAELHVYS